MSSKKQFIHTENHIIRNPLDKVLSNINPTGTLPIYANVLLEKQNDILYFTSISEDIQISTFTSIKEFISDDDAIKELKITTNAKKLAVILRSFDKNDNVNFSLENNNEILHLQCGKSKFKLQTLPPEDFPNMEDIDDADGENKQFTLSQNCFKNLLKQTQYAVGVKDIRYYLNGLFLEIKPHKINCVATDGHRMSVASQLSIEELPTCDAIIPLKAITEIIKLIGDNDAPITITINKSYAKFEFNNITLITKLIDAKFPEYQSVIPNDFKLAFSADRKELIKSIQRVAIINNDAHNRGVLFEVNANNNNLKISTQNHDQEIADVDLSINTTIIKDATDKDKEINIGFNIQYLLDKLNNTADDIVIFRLKNEDTSCLITGASYTISDEDLLTLPIENDGETNDNITLCYEKYVVMPMRI